MRIIQRPCQIAILRGTYNDGVLAVFGHNGAKFDLPPSIILKMLLEHTTRGTDEL